VTPSGRDAIGPGRHRARTPSGQDAIGPGRDRARTRSGQDALSYDAKTKAAAGILDAARCLLVYRNACSDLTTIPGLDAQNVDLPSERHPIAHIITPRTIPIRGIENSKHVLY
jgi:hypothetical protein